MKNAKRTLYCHYCNNQVHKHRDFFGKQLKVSYACPHCGSVNEYPLHERSDKIFLRLGFFMNPLYLPAKYYFAGAPLKWVIAVYPLFFILFLVINIIYMPYGLVANNIRIFHSKRRFYADNKGASVALIHANNLRLRADNGDHHAALLVGQKLLYGGTFAANEQNAVHYLTFAAKKYVEAAFMLGEYFYNKEQYEQAFPYFNASRSSAQALYYLALFYATGKGVSLNKRIAKIMLEDALAKGAVDHLDIKSLLL